MATTQDYAASIQGVSIRVTRLDAAGNLLNGAGDSYTTSAFMRVSFTPEYEEGDEITEKGANGVICVSYKAPDTLKRITMELAICEPDPELSALLSGGLLLRKQVNGAIRSVGWAAPGVGDDPAGNGVAVECWSHAVSGGKRATSLPYFHWVFPYAKFRQSGDRVIENGMMANTFEGYGLGNINFGAGLDGRWEFPVAAERPYAYSRSDWAPVGLKGFYTWSDNVTPASVFFTGSGIQGATSPTVTSITAAARVTSAIGLQTPTYSAPNITLTTSAAHDILIGQSVTIAGAVPTGYNGTWTAQTGTTGSTLVVNIGSNPGEITTAGTVRATDPGINYATVTMSNVTASGLANGDYVTINGAGDLFDTRINEDNVYIFNSAGVVVSNVNTSANTFTYTLTEPLSSAATFTAANKKFFRLGITDNATEAGTYTAVTSEAIDTKYAGTNTSPDAETQYNVPGNLHYNPDSNVDFIIKSNEDTLS
jgi:hypothetical protein